jgi:mono/diheme cytochrome c family protein
MMLRALVLAVLVSTITLGVWTAPGAEPGPELEDPGRLRWTSVVAPSPPESTDDLLALGDRLYGWNCMPCHGAEGKGDGPVAARFALQPRNYTRGLFKLKTSAAGEMPLDLDLYGTITTGIPASGMPSFAGFEPRERWALVAHVKSLALLTLEDGTVIRHFEREPERASHPLPARPPGLDPVRGARLFRMGAQCGVCHGPWGRGDGPASAGLVDAIGRPARVPDLTRGPVAFKAGDRAEDIFRVLSIGMPGSPMPSFATIPEGDRWDLAMFVTTLFERIPEGERVFLMAGCQSCHTVGRGRLIGPDLSGIRRRRTPDWLRQWLRDPPRMLQDEKVQAGFKDYPVPMPDLKLSDRQVDLLLQYLVGLPGN